MDREITKARETQVLGNACDIAGVSHLNKQVFAAHG